MYFHLFGKKRCKFCTKAVKLLESKKIEYIITYMEKAPSALEELKQSIDWQTVPIVLEVCNSEQVSFIGGFTELEEYLNGTKKESVGRGEGTDNAVADSL